MSNITNKISYKFNLKANALLVAFGVHMSRTQKQSQKKALYFDCIHN
jgi:hypothetical protein